MHSGLDRLHGVPAMLADRTDEVVRETVGLNKIAADLAAEALLLPRRRLLHIALRFGRGSALCFVNPVVCFFSLFRYAALRRGPSGRNGISRYFGRMGQFHL